MAGRDRPRLELRYPPTLSASLRHLPTGFARQRAPSAGRTLGYDEINRAAFLCSNVFPDSLSLPRMRAYSQVATAFAPTFDVLSPAITSRLDFPKARGTAIDGTFDL